MLKTTIKQILKSKWLFLLTTIGLSILISLAQAGFTVFLGQSDAARLLLKNYSITFFLNDQITEEQLNLIQERFKAAKDFSEFKYISKSDAEKVFLTENGSAMKQILDYNPLPASFCVTPAPEALPRIDSLLSNIKQLPGITDLYFQREAAFELTNYLHTFSLAIFLAALTLMIPASGLYYFCLMVLFSRWSAADTGWQPNSKKKRRRAVWALNILEIFIICLLTIGYWTVIWHFNRQFYASFLTSKVITVYFPAAVLCSAIVPVIIGSIFALFSLSRTMKTASKP